MKSSEKLIEGLSAKSSCVSITKPNNKLQSK
jgi:hypothetical protein